MKAFRQWFYENKAGTLVLVAGIAVAVVLIGVVFSVFVVNARNATATFVCPVGQTANPDHSSTVKCLLPKDPTNNPALPDGFAPVPAPINPADSEPAPVSLPLVLVDQAIDLLKGQVAIDSWALSDNHAIVALVISKPAYVSFLHQAGLDSSVTSDQLQLTAKTVGSMIDVSAIKAGLASRNDGVVPTDIFYVLGVKERVPTISIPKSFERVIANPEPLAPSVANPGTRIDPPVEK